jgi:hypothetical protein
MKYISVLMAPLSTAIERLFGVGGLKTWNITNSPYRERERERENDELLAGTIYVLRYFRFSPLVLHLICGRNGLR